MKTKVQTIWYMTKWAFYGLCIQMLCAGMLIASTSEAQKKSLQDIMLSVQLSDVELVRLFSELENNTNFNFAYNDSQIDEKQKLSLKVKNQSLYRVLRTISKETGLSFKRIDNNIFVQRKSALQIAVDDSSVADQADIDVSGKILDENSQGLPGASVVVKGTTKGTTTNLDGNYSLTAPDDATLVISFVGYVTQEVLVGARSKIDLTMTPDAAQLEEIVVVGYGSQKRSDLTGSVASVKGEDLAAMPVPTFDMALQGRTAGVNIVSNSGEPGGAVSIRIRGNNSISGNNEPLIVIDGFPMPSGGEASSNGVTDGNNETSNLLSFLNPSEIESLEVLKDASATAIYGSRGANGVIMVTTKKGTYGQAPKINIISETGISEIPSFPKLLDGPTFANWRNEVALADEVDPVFDGVDQPLPDDVATTSWVDRILRVGRNQRFQADVSGGNEATRYYISANYIKNEGILKHTAFDRVNFRANIDNKLTSKLSTNLSVNFAKTKNSRSTDGSGAIINAGPIFSAFKNSPTAVPGDPLDEGDGTTNFFSDPLVELSDRKDETANQNVVINLTTRYNILEGLDFNLRTGMNTAHSRREVYFPKTTRLGQLYGSRAVYNIFDRGNSLIESFLTYKKDISGHRLNLAGGFSWQQDETRRLNTRTENFPTDALNTDNVGFGLESFIPTSSRIKRTLMSYYGRANYNYEGRYFLTLTGRADGSSVFAANNKWGFFPSAAVGWTVTKESFMDEVASVSNLKLRASYGLTGAQSIAPLQSLTLLGVSNANINNVLVAGLAPVQLGNADLEWEKTTQFNIGLDFGLLEDRIYANLDYYVKTTDDLLQQFPLPSSSGFGFITSNAGSIENKGLEILVGGYVIDNKDFKWNTDFNWSNNKATVIGLGESGSDIFGRAPATNIVNNPANVMRVGEPFGAFYGYQVNGLIQESDFDQDGSATVPLFAGTDYPGTWKFADLNEDGNITPEDRQIIGNPNPDFIFGWNNSFSYKNFTLSVFMQGVVGNDLMNINRLFMATGRTANNALQDWYDNRWTVDNQHNDVFYPSRQDQGQLQPNSAIIEDGSYVRLKNVTLGYNIDPKGIIGLRSARVYITATNLLTKTNYSGFDPEVSMYGGSNLGQGLDFATYPRNRMYTIGVNIGF